MPVCVGVPTGVMLGEAPKESVAVGVLLPTRGECDDDSVAYGLNVAEALAVIDTLCEGDAGNGG